MRFTIDYRLSHFPWFYQFFSYTYTLWLFVIAMKNGQNYMCFDDLPIKNNDSP